MDDWRDLLPGDTLSWLLERGNPSARYWALREVLERPADDAEVQEAQAAIAAFGPVRRILEAQYPQGYWVHPGVGYSPKYRATGWQLIFLAALGLPRCQAIERACDYVLAHSRLPDGRFTAHKDELGAILCLNGNLLRALAWFGYGGHPLVLESYAALVEQMARDRFRCRCNAPAPRPRRMDAGQPCAWGAIKALGALLALSPAARTPEMVEALEMGLGFLLEYDLARGAYPASEGISPLWHKLGFPLGYTSDILEALDVLARAGRGHEPGLEMAWGIVLAKRDEDGRWPLEYTPGRMWSSLGALGRPSKWVTLRVLRARNCLRGPVPGLPHSA
jgi:hypothetical protein